MIYLFVPIMHDYLEHWAVDSPYDNGWRFKYFCDVILQFTWKILRELSEICISCFQNLELKYSMMQSFKNGLNFATYTQYHYSYSFKRTYSVLKLIENFSALKQFSANQILWSNIKQQRQARKAQQFLKHIRQ